jgi:RNA polymerase sigma-70 factor (ECF subfamily)
MQAWAWLARPEPRRLRLRFVFRSCDAMGYDLPSDLTWARRLAGHLVRDACADDLLQDALEAALRDPAPAPVPARAWLGGILRNLARMHARSGVRRERRERVALGADGDVGPARPDEEIERREALRLLASFVEALAEPGRAVLLLRYVEGLTTVEIARRRGEPEGTVRWRLKQALDELRARFDALYGGRREAWRALLVVGLGLGPRLPSGATAGAGVVTGAGSLGGGLYVGRRVVGLLLVGSLWAGVDAARVSAPAPAAARDTGTPHEAPVAAPAPPPLGAPRAAASGRAALAQAVAPPLAWTGAPRPLPPPRFEGAPTAPLASPAAEEDPGFDPARWLALAAAAVLPGAGCDAEEALVALRAPEPPGAGSVGGVGGASGEERPRAKAKEERPEPPSPDAGPPARPRPDAGAATCGLGRVIPAPAGGYDPSCPALSSPCREAGATKICLRVAQSGVRYAMEISCRPQRESGPLAWLGVVRGCLEGEGEGADEPPSGGHAE